MPAETQLIVDVAVLKKEMEAVTVNLADMKKVNQAQSDKLDTILTQLSEAKGGWRIMMLVGGAFVSVGAVVVGLLSLITGRH